MPCNLLFVVSKPTLLTVTIDTVVRSLVIPDVYQMCTRLPSIAVIMVNNAVGMPMANLNVSPTISMDHYLDLSSSTTTPPTLAKSLITTAVVTATVVTATVTS